MSRELLNACVVTMDAQAVRKQARRYTPVWCDLPAAHPGHLDHPPVLWPAALLLALVQEH